VIQFENVSKRYTPILGKNVQAVADFSLRVSEGEVLGIAGPNGAGKSTLINLLLGYIVPSEGTVTIGGAAPRSYVERNGVGYLSELLAIPPGWSLTGALRRYATLAGVPAGEVESRIDFVIDLLGLQEQRGKRIKALSKGNLQRLGLAQALLRDDVQLLVLDEPTHGLDPVWTHKFRDIVNQLRKPDRVILIASHNLDELERVADRVVIIDNGRLQRTVDVRGAPSENGAVRYRVIVIGDAPLASIFPQAVSLGKGEFDIAAESLEVLNSGIADAINRGIRVVAMHPSHSALERQFREAVGDRIQ
jgi:ABC-2 type transport system ATP-binding protein